MKRTHVIFLLVFLICLLGLSFVFLYSQRTVPTLPSNRADWYQYIDEQKGYYVSYPKTWSVEKACVGGLQNDTYICLKSGDLQLSPVPNVTKGFLITIAPPGSSYFNSSDTHDDFCKSTMDKIHCFPTVINGQKALRKEFANYPYIDIGIEKDNQIIFHIRLEYEESLRSSPESLEVFNQILNTFTLINQEPADGFCGGIAGIVCPSGYTCKLDGDYPDAGGTCVTSTNTTYTCPENGWEDCMPMLSPERQIQCSKEALEWKKANCPDFQGAAL